MHRKTQVLEMHFLHGCCPRSSPIFFEPMFAWLFVMTVCLTFTNQLWTENNNLTNFGCIQRTKNGNLLNHNPGEDEHISAKTSSKNSVFDLLKFFLWTENNNLTSFWCIQSIQSGNLLHSNPAKNEYILAGNRPRYIDETFLGWFFICVLVFPT